MITVKSNEVLENLSSKKYPIISLFSEYTSHQSTDYLLVLVAYPSLANTSYKVVNSINEIRERAPERGFSGFALTAWEELPPRSWHCELFRGVRVLTYLSGDPMMPDDHLQWLTKS